MKIYKITLLLVFSALAPLDGAIIVSAQQISPSPGKIQDQPPVKYEAEEGLPKDRAGEKRRDYAVLEAALNDLASPKNPEYKNVIQNLGLRREIVIDDKMSPDHSDFINLGGEDRNNDG